MRLHPVKGEIDHLILYAIGHPDMMLARGAKGTARGDGDLGLVQQVMRKLNRSVMIRDHAREYVIGPLRLLKLKHMWQPVEPVADQCATPIEDALELCQMHWLVFQGGKGGDLADAWRTDHRQIVDLHDLRAQHFGCNHVFDLAVASG
jgi:hypothetical protein